MASPQRGAAGGDLDRGGGIPAGEKERGRVGEHQRSVGNRFPGSAWVEGGRGGELRGSSGGGGGHGDGGRRSRLGKLGLGSGGGREWRSFLAKQKGKEESRAEG